MHTNRCEHRNSNVDDRIILHQIIHRNSLIKDSRIHAFRFHRIYQIIFLLLISAHFLFAQRLSFRNYSVKEGLSQSQITDIVQDKYGYLWFATAEGLTSFNGQDFVHFGKKEGLSGSYIKKIYIDSKGNFWLGHRATGLSKCTIDSNKMERIPLPIGQKSATICDILEDENGVFWFATENKGLFSLSNGDWTVFNQGNGFPTNRLTAIEKIAGVFWIGSTKGLIMFNPTLKGNERFRLIKNTTGLSGKSINALMKDSKGRLWIADSKSGVFVYKAAQDQSQRPSFFNFSAASGLPEVKVVEFYEDNDRNIWFATNDGGVISVSKPLKDGAVGDYFIINKKNGLKRESVMSIFQDREGSFWFGTDGGGVFQYNGTAFQQYGRAEGLQDDIVWCIFEDKSKGLWFGTEKGLSYFPDGIGGKVTYYNGRHWAGQNMVMDIIQDNKDRIWIGVHGSGPRLFDQKTQKFNLLKELDDKNIITMEQDRAGNIWFGSFYNGVFKYDLRTEEIKNFKAKDGLGSNTVFKIILSANGDLWFATNSAGITRFDGDHFTNYGQQAGLSAPSILSLCEDLYGNLWVGAEGDGLFKFDGENFENWTEKYGAWGEDIYSLINDYHGNLWIGTRRGIEKLNPATGYIKRYGEFEGFSAIETNQDAVMRDSRGRLWFGTIQGAICYNPSAKRLNPTPPVTYIDKVRVYYHERPVPEDREYSYDDNFFTFHFIGLSFIAPEKLRYSFMLEGLDRDWSPLTKDRYATYANLSPGDYVFKVKAVNSDRIWSDTPAVFTFSIAAPFWLQGWFFALIVCVIGLSVYGIHYSRVRRIYRNNVRLEEMVHARTEDLLLEKDKTQKAYEALLESENKLRQVTKSVNAFLWSAQVSDHGKIDFIFMTDTFKDITGHDLNQSSSQQSQFEYFLEIVHPDDRDNIEKLLASTLNGDKVDIIYRIIGANKEIHWIYDNAIPAQNEQGKVNLIHGVGFDVSDRKRTEEALKKSEEKYETFIRYSTEAIWCMDLKDPLPVDLAHEEQIDKIMHDAFLSDCNDAMAEMYGYRSSSEIIGIRLNKGLLRNSEQNREHLREFIQCGYRLKNAEFYEIDRHSNVRIILVSFVGIVEDKHLVRGWGMQRDITAKKKAEQALRESEEIYRRIIERSPDTIIVHSENKIDYINESGLTLFGTANRDQLIGQNLSHFIHSDYRSQFQKQLHRLYEEKMDVGISEQKMLRLDGTQFDVEVMATPLVYKGKSSGQSIIRDITDKKTLEEELQKAQKLESVGLLAGGIAHDFNNILTAILGNISLGKLYSKKDRRASSVLSEAEKATLRAKDLTQQLLTFSKGGAPLKEQTSIVDIIKESTSFVLRGSTIDCEYHYPQDIWSVDVDASQINQVIHNLVLNAEQAMPNGKKITIQLENISADKQIPPGLKSGRYVKITLSDQGIGISEDHLDKIFDPYFTTKQKGSGLGLATSYSIIKRHDGHLQIRSEIGVGTDVEIYLPASDKQTSRNKTKKDTIESGKGKILVMDDEQMLRDLSTQFLTHLGYEVQTVVNGESAIKFYQDALKSKLPFSLVIMDLTIPGGMGGKETIEHLRKIDPDIKAIVASGYSNDPILANYKKYGFSAVLTKPFKVETLSKVISSVLNGKK